MEELKVVCDGAIESMTRLRDKIATIDELRGYLGEIDYRIAMLKDLRAKVEEE